TGRLRQKLRPRSFHRAPDRSERRWPDLGRESRSQRRPLCHRTTARGMKTVNIHATCVRLGNAGKAFGAPANTGVLIFGPSGSGKSDLALRLIERGATLVADDRTDLFVERGRLCASAPKRIAGLMEVRGLGIIELRHAAKVQIALAVVLRKAVARMPVHERYEPPKPLQMAVN